MSLNTEILRGTLILIATVSLLALFLWFWLKRSREPGMLVARWIFSAALLAMLIWYTRMLWARDGYARIAVVLAGAACGAVMAVIWVPPLVDAVGRKVASLYDGGDEEVDQKPFYSIVHAQRKKGNYDRALQEVRKQLERFPTDFEGQMLLASLQAENLNDLPGAQLTIRRFCEQPGHAPRNISYALNQLADWHLKLTQDRDAAKAALEKIIELLPDTEMSLQAAQRIARLADTDALLAAHDRQRVTVRKGVENVGLLRDPSVLRPPAEKDPGKMAAEYVQHLEAHPLDSHVREQLAVLYAEHFQRLDVAADQLEQLIQQPNQPARNVARWLNLMADLQVQHGGEPEAIRATLQRIIDQFPDASAAQNARRRLDMLNLELKAKTKSQAVKLGSYEQNIGLKMKIRG